MLYPVAHVVGHDDAPLPRRVWHKGKAALRVGAAILKFHLGVSGAVYLYLGIGGYRATRIGKLHQSNSALPRVGRIQGVGLGLCCPQEQQGPKTRLTTPRVYKECINLSLAQTIALKSHTGGEGQPSPPDLSASSASQFCVLAA